MNLLHVIAGTDPESGGPIEAVLRISEVLIREGHQVAVLSLEEDLEVAKREFPFSTKGLGHGTRTYRYNAHLTPWLKENAKDFDAVVLHGLWNYTSFGSWRALKDSSTPYFIFAHGMMDPWFRKQFPLKHIAKQIFWTLAEGRVLRDANAVLFTCEEERTRARNVFKGHPYQSKVVLFGTADPTGNPASQREAFQSAFPPVRGRRFLLFLSRIHPKKGCDLLIQAFADLKLELPNDVDLVIAGPDQVGWATELQSMAIRLGVGERVHWPGMLKSDLKWGAFRGALALILPSHQENFGFVIAEAMACATPVLISNKVNIWREVQVAGAGFVEPDTLEGTRRLIRGFCALSDLERVKMKQHARAGFLERFDVRVTAREFARIISLVDDPPSDS
jgi:glycosyltransferase involved in cell wall biosynthesis